jgi:ubiquinone/menaquinone biosynthesis C-methylase UbiE
MHEHFEKFDVTRLERLNDEARFDVVRPEFLWSALGDPQPSTIVDIGAGTGLFARRFSQLAPDARVLAVDSSPVMVEWMASNLPAEFESRVIPLLSQESVVPLPDAEADLVVMIHLHHELADPLASYREAFRLLRPGGQVLVVDFTPEAGPGGPPLHIRATGEQIAAALVEAGFAGVVSHPGLPKDSVLTATRP